ncbi:MAG: hypothetical protein JNJ73_10200 [Hyphomonadaceae bacterium]|nr:hypothetical protein [Hyphomonadaceae bacterium]
MPDGRDTILHAVFVGVALPAATVYATTPYVAEMNATAQAEVMRETDQARLAETLGVQWIEMSEDRIGAEALVLRERGRGIHRHRVYVLGMSGSGSKEEAQLFRVLTFLEKVGALMAKGRVSSHDLGGYMLEDARRWREHLRALRDRSAAAPSLDQARFEQLRRAITAAEMLSGEGDYLPVATRNWQPLRLLEERVSLRDGQTWIEAVIRNENLVASPVPAVRVGARADDGANIGFWLLFPSDGQVPANGEITLRGSLPWPDQGVATGVALVTSDDDFTATSEAQRFPNRGRQTWDNTP